MPRSARQGWVASFIVHIDPRMDSFRALSTFVAVVECGNFNRAALQHGLTPQAVSKSIRQLEQHMEVRLFHRSPRQCTLTQEGERLLSTIRPVLDTLTQALSAAKAVHADEAGLVRITADGPVARRALLPLLAEFMQSHPRIEIELVLAAEFTDLAKHRIDVGFRAGAQPEGEVVARKLFPLQLLICASPDYLARHGTPQTLDDLQTHRCTAFRLSTTGRICPWTVRRRGATGTFEPSAVFSVNDTQSELEAVLAGIGIGQIDSLNAVPHLLAGRLQLLLPEHVCAPQALYLYYPRRNAMPRRVRLFIDFALARLRGSVAYHMPQGGDSIAA